MNTELETALTRALNDMHKDDNAAAVATRRAENKATPFARLAFAALLGENLSLDMLAAKLCEAYKAKDAKGKPSRKAGNLPACIKGRFNIIKYVYNSRSLYADDLRAFAEDGEGACATLAELHVFAQAAVAAYAQAQAAAESASAVPETEHVETAPTVGVALGNAGLAFWDVLAASTRDDRLAVGDVLAAVMDALREAARVDGTPGLALALAA